MSETETGRYGIVQREDYVILWALDRLERKDAMSRLSSIVVAVATMVLIGVAAVADQTKTRIPLSAAQAQCATLNGVSRVAQENYRACVLAKSGVNLDEVQEKKRGISISGSARFGIVYQEN